jgi:hypothetical protein
LRYFQQDQYRFLAPGRTRNTGAKLSETGKEQRVKRDMSRKDDQQERAREEIELAGGPVSQGAENRDAPVGKRQPAQPHPSSASAATAGQQPEYNKMLHTRRSETAEGTGMATDQHVTRPAGATLPNTGTSRGGINISNSTAGAGGSSTGAVSGAGMPRDRGSVDNVDLDQTSNTAQDTDRTAHRDAQSEMKAHPRKRGQQHKS